MKKLFFISLILINNIAFAEKTNSSVDNCIEKANGLHIEIIGCIDVEIKKQDRRLNTAYQNVMKYLANNRKEQLKKTQQIWINYRNANCDFYADPEGGTNAHLDAAYCVMDMTTQRAKELEDLSNLVKNTE